MMYTKIIFDNSDEINFFDFINFLFLTNPKSNKLLEKKLKKADLTQSIFIICGLKDPGSFKGSKRHQIPIVLKIHNFRYLCSNKFLSKTTLLIKNFALLAVLLKDFFLINISKNHILNHFSIRFSKKLFKVNKKFKKLKYFVTNRTS